jgi:phosphoesterase RecJ-like protein
MLEGMKFHGPVAVVAVTAGMYALTGTTVEDTENFVNYPLQISDVQVSVMLKHQAEGQWRVSLRSKGVIDISGVAAAFGGGGHRNASGCDVSGTLDEAEAALMAAIGPLVA